MLQPGQQVTKQDVVTAEEHPVSARLDIETGYEPRRHVPHIGDVHPAFQIGGRAAAQKIQHHAGRWREAPVPRPKRHGRDGNADWHPGRAGLSGRILRSPLRPGIRPQHGLKRQTIRLTHEPHLPP